MALLNRKIKGRSIQRMELCLTPVTFTDTWWALCTFLWHTHQPWQLCKCFTNRADHTPMQDNMPSSHLTERVLFKRQIWHVSYLRAFYWNHNIRSELFSQLAIWTHITFELSSTMASTGATSMDNLTHVMTCTPVDICSVFAKEKISSLLLVTADKWSKLSFV